MRPDVLPTTGMKQRLEDIHQRIDAAADEVGRDPSDVHLVAVTKTISAERIQTAIESGVDTIGENYVQEARDKFSTLGTTSVSWHFIGHLQRNKVKYVVRMFDLIHSVDSKRLADEINKQAKKVGKVQSILIQVNLAGEKSKSGVAPQEAKDLVHHIITLPHLSLQGLMTMPPFFNAPKKVRPYFKQLRHLRDQLKDSYIEHASLHELSMGMTGDFETAIAEGATMVRVGTALFGARQ